MTALKNRSFSDAMIAVQAKYNLEHCNTIKNSAGRRVWGFTGVKVITKPSYTDGFMDTSQCTYRKNGQINLVRMYVVIQCKLHIIYFSG